MCSNMPNIVKTLEAAGREVASLSIWGSTNMGCLQGLYYSDYTRAVTVNIGGGKRTSLKSCGLQRVLLGELNCRMRCS